MNLEKKPDFKELETRRQTQWEDEGIYHYDPDADAEVYAIDTPPWKMLVVSGWGLAPEGSGKISKSKGGGSAKPEFLLEKYSADALRYWAAGTGLGKDTVIDEERMRAA
jgi:valyl-tRNA synthetase